MARDPLAFADGFKGLDLVRTDRARASPGGRGQWRRGGATREQLPCHRCSRPRRIAVMRVRGGLLFRCGVAQMAAHVADQIGSDAPLHEAPLPVATREAVLVPTAYDRLQNQVGQRLQRGEVRP
jgi:hypothetical protein